MKDDESTSQQLGEQAGQTSQMSEESFVLSEPIPVAMIGLGSSARRTLEALADCPSARVVGVADRDSQKAQQAGREFEVPHYTDNRQLLLGTKPAILFLATPPMPAMDIMDYCASLGIHVWKEAPLGRNLAEAASMARRFEDAELKLAVGTQRRFAETYRHAFDLRTRIGQAFLAHAQYFFNWGTDLQWRADTQSAGGGALLELGYHFIDLLVWLLGLPEEVYGLTTCSTASAERLAESGRPEAPHDTEDNSSALLRYRYDAMATFSVSRISGPVSEQLSLRGHDGSLVALSDSCTLRNPDGDVIDHLQDESTPQDIFRRQVDSFIQAVAANAGQYQCSALENLMTHAVIDAIYLSNQTCRPESPLRQLEIHGMSPAECLKYAEI